MRILLTNDDGFDAEGIYTAWQVLSQLGTVFVVAPERQRSAAGHAITLHKPLRLIPATLHTGMSGYMVNGTPADCVALGYEIVMENSCDLVVSGINSGANLGWDLTYSGTVAAAMEGAVAGIPSLAISLVLHGEKRVPDYTNASQILSQVVNNLEEFPLQEHTFLNINVPNISGLDHSSVRYTHVGRVNYSDRLVKRNDPSGRPYYWLGGVLSNHNPEPGSDVEAVSQGYISITPVHFDMTDYTQLERLKQRYSS